MLDGIRGAETCGQELVDELVTVEIDQRVNDEGSAVFY